MYFLLKYIYTHLPYSSSFSCPSRRTTTPSTCGFASSSSLPCVLAVQVGFRRHTAASVAYGVTSFLQTLLLLHLPSLTSSFVLLPPTTATTATTVEAHGGRTRVMVNILSFLLLSFAIRVHHSSLPSFSFQNPAIHGGFRREAGNM